MNTLDIRDALLFDVGGASSELMLVRDRKLRHVVSLPYGALNLRELHRGMSDPEAADAARQTMISAMAYIPWLQEAKRLQLVGLGGTARAIAKLQLAQEKHEGQRLHGYVVHPSFIREQFRLFSQMGVSKRKKVRGISKSRAKILVAGLAPVDVLTETLQPSQVVISRNGLREGIVFECLLKNQTEPLLESVLEHSVRNFQKTFGVSSTVAEMVTSVAMRVFDSLQTVHNLSEHDRKLLWVIAQIESCGCYINTEKWTRHSAYLVLSSYLYGLTYPELDAIFELLTNKEAAVHQQMAILLRLAKLLTLQLGMDVRDINIVPKTGKVYIKSPLRTQNVVLDAADGQVVEDFERCFAHEMVFIQAVD